MVAKPTVFPVWASQDQVDPISQQNNVLTPPPVKQLYGWSRLEFPPRNWFNWLARTTNNWLQYLAQQEGQASVSAGTGQQLFDAVVGGLVYIYVVDKVVVTNVYHGMAYLPPGSVGATFIDIKKVGITTPVITSGGNVTISGGTGPYIVYGQTKTIA